MIARHALQYCLRPFACPAVQCQGFLNPLSLVSPLPQICISIKEYTFSGLCVNGFLVKCLPPDNFLPGPRCS